MVFIQAPDTSLRKHKAKVAEHFFCAKTHVTYIMRVTVRAKRVRFFLFTAGVADKFLFVKMKYEPGAAGLTTKHKTAFLAERYTGKPFTIDKKNDFFLRLEGFLQLVFYHA